MKLTILLMSITGAALTSAACAPTETFPACAVACITSAVAAVGCKAADDYACQCRSSSALAAAASPCINSACGQVTASQVASAAAALCSACHP